MLGHASRILHEGVFVPLPDERSCPKIAAVLLAFAADAEAIAI